EVRPVPKDSTPSRSAATASGTWGALIESALAGDPASVRRLIAELSPIVQNRAARILLRRSRRPGNVRQQLEDLVQEVLVSLFDDKGRALRAWSPKRGLSFEGFVGLVAERQIISILRSGKRSGWLEDPTDLSEIESQLPAVASPEAAIASKEVGRSVLDRLRERLSATGLEVFHALLVEEREISEVAKETGLSPGALYTWKSRILGIMREIHREIE